MQFSSSVGAAVVGTGFIGPVHVEAIRRLGHRVVGILGSTAAKSAAAASSLNLEKGYATYAELLADPAVRVVHLASPNKLHREQCLIALAAGKHVVCEKPLAMTATEARELVVAAAAHPHLVTAVNYNVRFYPLILEARERLLRGDFGTVFHIVGSYLQDWLLEATDYNWRVDAEAGGDLRAVADIGTHWLDTILFVTGLQVSEVFADLQIVHPTRYKPVGGRETFSAAATANTGAVPIATEDAGTILLRFTSGAKATLTVSQVCAGRKNCIRFDLAAATASLSWNSEEPNALTLGRRAGTEVLERGPGRFSDYPAGHAEGFPDTVKMLYRAVYADILAGRPSTPPLYATFADGLRELELCEAILTSHREQRWVKVSSKDRLQ